MTLLSACGDQETASECLEVELPMVVSYLVRVLGTELAFSHQAMSPASTAAF